MTIHKLKLNAAYYDDSASGIKTFEIRKMTAILRLAIFWNCVNGFGVVCRARESTRAKHWKIITYILDDEEYLHDGYVCLPFRQ